MPLIPLPKRNNPQYFQTQAAAYAKPHTTVSPHGHAKNVAEQCPNTPAPAPAATAKVRIDNSLSA